MVLGEEEYENSNHEIKTKLVVSQVKTVEEIKNGDFKVPAPKKLAVESSNVSTNDFMPINDIVDDLPFN